jgi:regulator of cell morphogenesis and NO signaling
MIFLSFIKYFIIFAKKINMENLRNQAVGDIVARNFRTAAVFSKAGIDFCCGGKKNITESWIEKGIDINDLETELNKVLEEPVSRSHNFNEWKLGFLADYILNTHHTFVKEKLPDLVFYTRKIASVHGDNHPELMEVASLFGKISDELTQHLVKEEEVLFPAIKEVSGGKNLHLQGIIKSEIQRMLGEHEFAGGAMDTINRLTSNYLIPSDACNTYMVTLKLLKEFEDDLHIHVHLENNILFPKSLKIADS